MPGRTKKTDARDVENQAWAILFETDEVRKWLLSLANRARRNAEKAHDNSVISLTNAREMEALAVAATQAAYDLDSAHNWVKQRT